MVCRSAIRVRCEVLLSVSGAYRHGGRWHIMAGIMLCATVRHGEPSMVMSKSVISATAI